MLFRGCPLPSSARLGASREEPGPLRCLLQRGTHTAEHMAFDFWTILNEKASVVHTEAQKEVLGFQVNVSPEKAVRLGLLHTDLGSWPLSGGIAHSRMHLLSL